MIFFVATAAASGCGGGAGGGSPAPPPPVAPPPPANTPIAFLDATAGSGLSRAFSIVEPKISFAEEFASGLAAADYDDDGDIDLYVVGGNAESNHLFQNRGDGSFVDVAAGVGLDMRHLGSGPTFADIDGDGDLDLFVGGIDDNRYFVMENRDGAFLDVTAESGIVLTASNTVSATFGDYDLDGDLDLFLSHWGNDRQTDTETVWRNNGEGVFESASIESGIAQALFEVDEVRDHSFTPNLSDLDNDGDSDLLMASDFGTSQIFLNNGDGTFTKITDREVVIDQAGMGAAVGDYDNDGDMDWFVSSIHDGDTFHGNRLYRNDGDGIFADVTEFAGVADGGWGWASCFADFDNDGYLDLLQVNGWRGGTGVPTSGRPGRSRQTERDYSDDRIRFFHAQGDGTFAESARAFGLTDQGQGRGVACFDAERDGDIDIVLTNNDEDHLVFYRNVSENENHYLAIRLEGEGANRHGIGAWISVTTSVGAQVREVRAGNNYVSQNPMEVHFGLGAATSADVVVFWPDGNGTTVNDISVDQLLTLRPD